MTAELLQIYRDTYRLCLQLYLYINNVPKYLRYGEYSKTISLSLDALDSIYVANTDEERRSEVLLRFLLLTGGVRSRIRLFTELKYLSPKQSINLCFLIDKVQKLAAGWRKSSLRQNRQVNDKTGERP